MELNNTADIANSLLDFLYRQTKSNPDKIALEDSVRSWTYATLQLKAMAVANRLNKLKTKPGIVCILGGKENMTVATVIGAWICGWSYYIVDEHFPAEKVARLYSFISPDCTIIVNNSGDYPSTVMQKALEQKQVFTEVDFSEQGTEPNALMSDKQYSLNRNAEDIALFTLTSGTTGIPKTIAISHRAWIYAINRQVKECDYLPTERVAIQSRFACDGIYDTLCAFAVGGTAVLIGSDLFYNTTAWVETIKQKKISCLPIIPSVIQLLAEDTNRADIPPCIKKIVFAGDYIHSSVADFLRKKCAGSTAIYNMYGSSEFFFGLLAEVSINNPRQTNQFAIVENSTESNSLMFSPTDKADVCLLMIKNPSLFSGYLTDDHALQLPLDARGYFSTGDLFLKKEQNISLIGRLDRQINWYGYRIEPEEIERALCAHKHISGAHLYTDVTETATLLLCDVISTLPITELQKLVRSIVSSSVYSEYENEIIIRKVTNLRAKIR